MCDNCRHPKPKQEVSSEMTLALQAVQATDGKVAINHIIEILTGDASNDVKAYEHHKLPMFAKGKTRDNNFWKTIVRQGMVRNLITKNIELYGLLNISDEGIAYLKDPFSIQIAEDQIFEKVSDEDFEIIEIENIYDEELYVLLKELQRTVAREMNLPPYVIFQETSLEEMATKYPITLEEMENISGVGKNKAKKFGPPFIARIAQYVEENDIERPEDLVLKTVANKSGKKVLLIQNIDKKMSLVDIAKSQGMTYQELLDDLENIVYSGTKLDLFHEIEELMDEDVIEEIFDYFRSNESNDLDEAVRAFDGDFSHEEMQLLRIQFISEVAN
jgi:ATP-dependent DNA helicase RecQ